MFYPCQKESELNQQIDLFLLEAQKQNRPQEKKAVDSRKAAQMNIPSGPLPEDPYLNLNDFMNQFKCKDSKARLLMDAVGVYYIGGTPMVPKKKVEEHLEKYGEIRITWPKRKKKNTQ